MKRALPDKTWTKIARTLHQAGFSKSEIEDAKAEYTFELAHHLLEDLYPLD